MRKWSSSNPDCSIHFDAPGMGDNLVVRVHYALGSRKR